MNYEFPLDETWTKEEIIDVVQFFTLIEKAYESRVRREDVIALYRRFKEIVPSKSEEKKLFAAFNQSSGYAAFPVIRQASQNNEKFIDI